ncbi:MAG: hypothetical protein EGP94_03635 [Lachnospiraceae bacterium]|nr:hypothetical protein [Lachnospiraceae bacterium]
MVECRLRDPPQAENPVEQDSFSFMTIECTQSVRSIVLKSFTPAVSCRYKARNIFLFVPAADRDRRAR